MEGWRHFAIKLSTEPLQTLRHVVVVIVLWRREEAPREWLRRYGGWWKSKFL